MREGYGKRLQEKGLKRRKETHGGQEIKQVRNVQSGQTIKSGQNKPKVKNAKNAQPLKEERNKPVMRNAQRGQPLKKGPQREKGQRVAGGANKKDQGGKMKKGCPDAAAGACPHRMECGGCDYQGMPYEAQLKRKQDDIEKLLRPYAKVRSIVGMEDPYHYRCKVQAAFDYVKGSVVAGEYRKNSREVVDLASCQIENEEATAIIQTVKRLLASFRIRTYDEDSGYGLLRHVLVRVGDRSGEIMVVLVLRSPVLPSRNNFVKALRREHPGISTVVINVNDKRTSMVLGERNIVIYGRGYIEDELCGLTFRISPGSFYQVNPRQTERLYQKAVEYAGLSGRERVIDAYCGTGTIGLVASRSAGSVIGVELNRDAVRDAVANAKRNGIKNVRFYNDDAGQFMTAMAEDGEKADVVILDPPRSGCSEAFLNAVVKLAPQKIVYVSCGPETLARDLGYLVKRGYRGEECTPFDCFPFTKHVECVVLMSRVGMVELTE